MNRKIAPLVCMMLALSAGTAHGYMAVAFSPSTNQWGGSKNADSRQDAVAEALRLCKRKGGGDDCAVIQTSDERGFGALYQCVGPDCGVVAVTGRLSQTLAHADGKAACERRYHARCQPAAVWEETVGAAPEAEPPREAPRRPAAESSAKGDEPAGGNAMEADNEALLSRFPQQINPWVCGKTASEAVHMAEPIRRHFKYFSVHCGEPLRLFDPRTAQSAVSTDAMLVGECRKTRKVWGFHTKRCFLTPDTLPAAD